jgi:hypothetical protein
VSLLVPWLVFPLVLGTLCLGCGLLLERLAGVRLPRALLLPCGYAAIVVVGVMSTTNGATAPLTTPFVVALAVAGLALALPWRPPSRIGWPFAAALGVFAVYGAPVLMSGHATFAGYIELDDTSTWLGFTDRLMTHGRTLGGLPPSTYQAALDWYWRQNGYPVGAFPPLGIVHTLVRTDSAWLIQAYISFGAALLALGLYALLRDLVRPRPLRTLAAFVAAQPALLYGYALWGGSKELPTAALLVTIAALAAIAVREPPPARGLLPLAVSSAALIEILDFGGGLWLIPLLVPALVAGLLVRGRRYAQTALAFAALVLLLSIPPLASAGGFFDVTSKLLTKESELGNLVHRLSWLQPFGIWPVGDFRLRPHEIGLTYVLIGIVVASGVAGLVWAWRRRSWSLPLYVAGAVLGCVVAVAVGSPWVDAKALAITSPAIVVAAMAGGAWLFGGGRRVEGAVVLALVTGGVLWSNALAYHDVWLAPRSQLLELETIGKRFDGDGPTLMTEYQPYGVRHFIRDMAPEATSELRTRADLLLDGRYVNKGGFADLDQLRLQGILAYRTLVLLRTPAASRPPAVYDLVWRGRFYDVWQRPERPAEQIVEHLPLGSGAQAAAVPSCDAVLGVGRRAGEGGRVAAVVRPPATVLSFSRAEYPAAWARSATDADAWYPNGGGTLRGTVTVPADGSYGLSLAGSFRRRLQVWLDGRLVVAARNQLNHPGAYTPLAAVRLLKGPHSVVLRYGGDDLRPGSGGVAFAMGPLVLSRTTQELPVTYVAPADAQSLCGKNLDWVEAIR